MEAPGRRANVFNGARAAFRGARGRGFKNEAGPADQTGASAATSGRAGGGGGVTMAATALAGR